MGAGCLIPAGMAMADVDGRGGRDESLQATTQNRPEEQGKDKKGDGYSFIHSDHRTIKVYAQLLRMSTFEEVRPTFSI